MRPGPEKAQSIREGCLFIILAAAVVALVLIVTLENLGG